MRLTTPAGLATRAALAAAITGMVLVGSLAIVAAIAIAVLPTLGPANTATGLRSTHPSLETRLEQLRSLATD